MFLGKADFKADFFPTDEMRRISQNYTTQYSYSKDITEEYLNDDLRMIHFSVPGAKEENISVSLDKNNVLFVAITKSQIKKSSEFYSEKQFSQPLKPSEVVDSVEYENGVLSIGIFREKKDIPTDSFKVGYSRLTPKNK